MLTHQNAKHAPVECIVVRLVYQNRKVFVTLDISVRPAPTVKHHRWEQTLIHVQWVTIVQTEQQHHNSVHPVPIIHQPEDNQKLNVLTVPEVTIAALTA